VTRTTVTVHVTVTERLDMTALGFIYPGHSAEDDYPRMEQLLGSDIRVDVVHTELGEDVRRVDVLRETGAPGPLADACEQLRLSGAEAVVWVNTAGSFVDGWEASREQVRSLAVAAGMPASSASFAFAHAVREVGAHRVSVAATYPEDVAELFVRFLEEGAGVRVTSVHGAGAATAAEVAAWGPDRVHELVLAADHPDAEAVLVPDSALHTVSSLPALEAAVGKPVLTANQVSAWEALRLTDRRVNAPELGALFTREPLVQV
jgi:maleate cis-trans isomerase